MNDSGDNYREDDSGDAFSHYEGYWCWEMFSAFAEEYWAGMSGTISAPGKAGTWQRQVETYKSIISEYEVQLREHDAWRQS